MRKRELDRYRKLLEERRAEVVDKAARIAGEGRSTVIQGGEDYVDDAVTNYTREFLLSLSSLEQKRLAMIEDALERIEDGSYGECEMCGEKIGSARLKAVPWAEYCIRCQEKVEQESPPDGAIVTPRTPR
ncbi:MAG: TraR/DksA family transcriptional regulator [Acidobacteriota bacterium]|nr:TraR/DksA family transcriptional regulator [Acidobacteriota bacterium]MDQ7088308.1 TraR/DksA family transcriptional regulator [Acidobacteriota bacterium]